mmetsp:Transcript_20074/g.55750  ORF Transcript_20074/g.55750 Transcript_20074/m.55750 type:complete len:202 (-) Transcript_20074:510-1115(-)
MLCSSDITSAMSAARFESWLVLLCSCGSETPAGLWKQASPGSSCGRGTGRSAPPVRPASASSASMPSGASCLRASDSSPVPAASAACQATGSIPARGGAGQDGALSGPRASPAEKWLCARHALATLAADSREEASPPRRDNRETAWTGLLAARWWHAAASRSPTPSRAVACRLWSSRSRGSPGARRAADSASASESKPARR